MSLAVVQEESGESSSSGIRLSIARSRAELTGAFQLVHQSYVRAGLDTPNSLGLRLTKFHLQPSSQVILAYKAESPIATASLFFEDHRGLPAEAMYGAELERLRRRGLRVAEVGSFADCRESVTRFIHMFRRLTTLLAQVAESRGCNGVIVTAHPKHAKFYARQLGFEQFGDTRKCPYVQGKPAVALVIDFEKHRGTPVYDHLFGQRYTPEELTPYCWDAETRQHFTSVLAQIQKPTPAFSAPLAPSIASTASLPDLTGAPFPPVGG